jgi:hypothetical protein
MTDKRKALHPPPPSTFPGGATAGSFRKREEFVYNRLVA